jgi:hypothetical protein
MLSARTPAIMCEIKNSAMVFTSHFTKNLAMLFTDYLYEHPLSPLAVEFAVKDLFPRTEVQFAVRDRHHYFPAHDRALKVRVTVVFSGSVMPVFIFSVWSELFNPLQKILMQPFLLVVDKNRTGNMHGIDKAQTFLYAAFSYRLFDVARDIYDIIAILGIERKIFGMGFHSGIST